ncbi:hypothetical protein Emag_000370 [Eimeria magna]
MTTGKKPGLLEQQGSSRAAAGQQQGSSRDNRILLTTQDRKWADFELEDEGDLADLAAVPGGFETRPDEEGIKTVTNYLQNSKGETVKLLLLLLILLPPCFFLLLLYSWREVAGAASLQLEKEATSLSLGSRQMRPARPRPSLSGNHPTPPTTAATPAATATTAATKTAAAAAAAAADCVVGWVNRSVEEVPLEVSKETLLRAKFRDDDDDEDIQFADLNPAKTSRDLRQKFLSLQNDEDPIDGGEFDALGSKLGGMGKGLARLRGSANDSLKDLESRRREEATIRVTNLSEDVKEEDLTELFGTIGKLERVFLAKHKDKKASKGFAFITYATRDMAAQAIRKLNRHGYDNLLLNQQQQQQRQRIGCQPVSLVPCPLRSSGPGPTTARGDHRLDCLNQAQQQQQLLVLHLLLLLPLLQQRQQRSKEGAS